MAAPGSAAMCAALQLASLTRAVARDRPRDGAEVEILRLHHAEKWPPGTIAAQLGVHHDVVRPSSSRTGRRPVNRSGRGHQGKAFLFAKPDFSQLPP